MARVSVNETPWPNADDAAVERMARNSALGLGAMDTLPTPDKTTRGAFHYIPGAETTTAADQLVLPFRDDTGTILNHYPLLGTESNALITGALTFILNGQGQVISTGVHGDLSPEYGGQIIGARALADQVGSLVADVWVAPYANFPPTDTDSITASAPITISADDCSYDTTLTGWTTAFSAYDTVRFNVDSCSTITRCTLILYVQRTI